MQDPSSFLLNYIVSFHAFISMPTASSSLKEDINNALHLRNFEPMFGYVGKEKPKDFVRVPGHPEVTVARDKELTIDQVQLPCSVMLSRMVHIHISLHTHHAPLVLNLSWSMPHCPGRLSRSD